MDQPIKNDIIEKTADYVRVKLLGEPSGRDWYHVERVRNAALYLQKQEGGDALLVELSALLHDVGDYKKYEFNEKKGDFALKAMMDILDIDLALQKQIMLIVKESQYNGAETVAPSTIEGKIIQDSDWLDSMGAIGIARTFAFGGNINRVIHDPKRSPRPVLSRHDYQKKKFEGTTLNFFYEKQLKLPSLMNTAAGKILARQRVEFLKQYIKEFFIEWNLEDLKNIK